MRRPATKSEPAPTSASALVRAWPRFPGWLVAVLLALVTIVLYWPATGHDFVSFDDTVYVLDNTHVTSGLSWQSLRWAFRNLEAGYWHPLTWLSVMVDCQFYGLQARGHHLTSVLLHAANTSILFLALRRMTGATWRSAFAAALFGVHPLHVESVAWVSERKDVLSAFFFLLALWAYVRYVQAAEVRGPRPEARELPSSMFHLPSSLFYLLSLAFFLCGLMSKPMVVILPLMLLLLDWWPLERFSKSTINDRLSTVRQLLWEKAPFLAAAFVCGMVTLYAEKGIGALGTAAGYPLAGRVENALLSYMTYLKQTLWPADLAVFYPYPEALPGWQVAAAGSVGIMISALVLWAPRKRPYLAVGWAWYLVTLLPVIGLIKVGDFSRADRFTYLPLIGVFLALTWGAYELARPWRHPVMALSLSGSVTIVLCLALTRHQLGYWKDSETLFRHALEVTENNRLAHEAIGDAFYQQGRIAEAIGQFQEALRLKPGYAEVHNKLGNALEKKGRLDEAISQYQEALRLKPGYADAHNNLGNTLDEKGQLDEAIGQYQEALRLKPDHVQALYNLGMTLLQKGRLDEAVASFQKVLESRPHSGPAHVNLGNALLQKGRLDEAMGEYQTALEADPGYADAYNNLAWVLATCPEAPVRNGERAVVLAERANQLSGDRNPAMLGTLAAAYAEAGRYSEAVATAKRADHLAASGNDTAQAHSLQTQIGLYQAGSPFRDTSQTNAQPHVK